MKQRRNVRILPHIDAAVLGLAAFTKHDCHPVAITQLDLEVRPVSGAEIDELVATLAATPSEIRKLAAEASATAP